MASRAIWGVDVMPSFSIPASLTPYLLGAGAVGTVASTIGTISSAEAAGKTAAYSAQVAKNNATIASQNAEEATQAGNAKAEAQGLEGRQKLASIIATEAASGTDVGTGSNKEVAQSQRELNQLDTETTIQNAALQAYGYRSQATGYEATAGLEESAAQQAPFSAAFGGASTLFQGAGNFGLTAAKLNQVGLAGAGTSSNSPATSNPSLFFAS